MSTEAGGGGQGLGHGFRGQRQGQGGRDLGDQREGRALTPHPACCFQWWAEILLEGDPEEGRGPGTSTCLLPTLMSQGPLAGRSLRQGRTETWTQ